MVSPIITSTEDFRQLIQERDKQILQEVQKIAKTTAEAELALSDFELLYAVTINKQTKEQNAEWFKSYREKKWKEALIKAKSDELKALSIYGE